MDTTVENFSFLVSVLSAIVTLLIGWQIYATIDIRILRRDLMRQKEGAKRESNKTFAVHSLLMSNYYRSKILNSTEVDHLSMFLFHRANAIYFSYKNDDFKTCEDLCKSATEIIDAESSLSKYTQETILRTLGQCGDKQELPSLPSLIIAISKIRTVD